MIGEKIEKNKDIEREIRDVLHNLSYKIIENEFKMKKERVKILGVKKIDEGLLKRKLVLYFL